MGRTCHSRRMCAGAGLLPCLAASKHAGVTPLLRPRHLAALCGLAWALSVGLSGCLLEDDGGSAGLGATTASPPTAVSATATVGTGGQGPHDAGTTGSTTGGFCFPNGVFVGLGNPSVCCSDELDSSGYCGLDGGIVSPPCPPGCDNRAGYHCEVGQCVLNGDDGSLQFTLNWENTPRTPEDLDLHVIEPGGCEIYWGNRQCVGKLDLDANAGCRNSDPDGGFGGDVENIIYAPG